MENEIIKKVKVREYMYNKRVPGYKDARKRAQDWMYIGNELNKPATYCKRKWMELYKTYHYVLMERQKEVIDVSYGKKIKWQHEDNLEFLMPFVIELMDDDKKNKTDIEATSSLLPDFQEPCYSEKIFEDDDVVPLRDTVIEYSETRRATPPTTDHNSYVKLERMPDSHIQRLSSQPESTVDSLTNEVSCVTPTETNEVEIKNGEPTSFLEVVHLSEMIPSTGEALLMEPHSPEAAVPTIVDSAAEIVVPSKTDMLATAPSVIEVASTSSVDASTSTDFLASVGLVKKENEEYHENSECTGYVSSQASLL